MRDGITIMKAVAHIQRAIDILSFGTQRPEYRQLPRLDPEITHESLRHFTESPVSVHDECKDDLIHQKNETCYMLAVTLLLTKIKPLYALLNDETKGYLNFYRGQKTPNDDLSASNLLPAKVHDEYMMLLEQEKPWQGRDVNYDSYFSTPAWREATPAKRKEFRHNYANLKELQATYTAHPQFRKARRSANSYTHEEGGWQRQLLLAILRASGIPCTVQTEDRSQEEKEGTLEKLYDPIEKEEKLLLWRDCSAPKKKRYGKWFKVLIETVVRKSHPHKPLGGILDVDEHAIAFTICNGQAMVCDTNQPRCDNTYTSKKVGLGGKKDYVLRVAILFGIGPNWESKAKKFTPRSIGKHREFDVTSESSWKAASVLYKGRWRDAVVAPSIHDSRPGHMVAKWPSSTGNYPRSLHPPNEVRVKGKPLFEQGHVLKMPKRGTPTRPLNESPPLDHCFEAVGNWRPATVRYAKDDRDPKWIEGKAIVARSSMPEMYVARWPTTGKGYQCSLHDKSDIVKSHDASLVQQKMLRNAQA